MTRLVEYFIRHPIWANVLMLSVLFFGYFTAASMKNSFFPEMESETILVEVVYPGASPEEMEKSVVLKIEENLEGLSGVEQITSVSSENSARLVVTAFPGSDMQEVLSDVKNAVDRINPYPVGAEKPVVYIQKVHQQAMTVALYGNADLWALKQHAEKYRDELIAVEGVSQIDIQGLPSREIAITVSEADLRRYDLDFGQIARAVRENNLDLSAGKLETPEEEVLIRVYGEKYFSEELLNTVIKSLPDGTLLHLGDVAQVVERWEDSPRSTYYNGERAIMIEVSQTLEEDILHVAKVTREKLEAFSQKYPQIKTAVVSDRTVHLKGRIQLLQKNGFFGLILVVLSLGLFLNWRVAGWVSLGIPFSFAGMFILAGQVGLTINVISLFGMIIVVGMLVDDAIVVAENIFQKAEGGVSAVKAAVQGTMEVIAPVFTAVSTTVIAFLPFFFFEGRLGKLIWQVAFVVIGALIFSLIESLLVLPVHLAHSKGIRMEEKNKHGLRVKLEETYRWITNDVFGPCLAFAMRNRFLTVAAAYTLFFLSIGVLRAGWVGISGFPHIARDNFSVDFTLTSGTQEQVTDSVLRHVEEHLWALNEELSKEREDSLDVVVAVRREVGSNGLRETGSHAGKLDVELLEGEERNLDVYVVANQLRERVGPIAGVEKASYGGGGQWGKPITISLLGDNYASLKAASLKLQEELREYDLIKDVLDTDAQGRREIRFQLKPLAKSLGLTLQDVAIQVRQGFFGTEVQRLQRGRDEIRLWVRYREEDRRSFGQLERMRIRTVGGAEYPLSELVDYTVERGIVNIVHLDGRREIRVEADLSDPNAAVEAVMGEIKTQVIPPLLSEFPDVKVSYEGRDRDNARFARSAKKAFPMALAGILIILTLVFRSPLQAVLIFVMIPLGLIGAIGGHWLHGLLLSRLSMFGIIALSGIVINGSIVYMDQINRNLRAGMKYMDAVHQAGISRFRPILLTTITTVFGLGPIILETSRQAQFLIPMAVSIAYGLLAASVMILFVVPSLFLILNDLRYGFHKLFKRVVQGQEPTRESVEPAVRELREWEEVK